jgi:type VI secretion system VasD/TssJ family lipoprotein
VSLFDDEDQLRRGRGLLVCALTGLLACLGTLACTTTGVPVQACIDFEASDELNTYESEPHALTLYVYPLESADLFERADVDALLEGFKPEGIVAPPVPLTISPGEEQSFERTYPSGTRRLGLLADYYSTPRQPAGRRLRVLPVRCGLRRPSVSLARNGID